MIKPGKEGNTPAPPSAVAALIEPMSVVLYPQRFAYMLVSLSLFSLHVSGHGTVEKELVMNIAVVGAGPAGLACATTAASKWARPISSHRALSLFNSTLRSGRGDEAHATFIYAYIYKYKRIYMCVVLMAYDSSVHGRGTFYGGLRCLYTS